MSKPEHILMIFCVWACEWEVWLSAGLLYLCWQQKSCFCIFWLLNHLFDSDEICSYITLNFTLSGPVLNIHLPGISTVVMLNVPISSLFVSPTTTTFFTLVLYVLLIFELWCMFMECKIVHPFLRQNWENNKTQKSRASTAGDKNMVWSIYQHLKNVRVNELS